MGGHHGIVAWTFVLEEPAVPWLPGEGAVAVLDNHGRAPYHVTTECFTKRPFYPSLVPRVASSRHAKGRGLLARSTASEKRRAVSVDHLSPTAPWLYVGCVSALEPPENGRSMAASDRADGQDQCPS